jgi:RNA polymerase sigma factor (sigma-70 family)
MSWMARADDSRLVAAARAGDRSAFAVLIARHHGSLLKTCQRTVGDLDLGTDAAQEGVLRAMLTLDRLRHDNRFGAWLLGIGLNVCRQMVRDRGAGVWSTSTGDALDDVGAPPGVSPDPAESAASADVADRIRHAIAELPPGQRDAVALFYLAGLTQAEIAAHLGTAVGAVKTRLHKARASLRPRLIELWKEQFEMTEETAGGVPMRITDVRRTGSAESETPRHIVFLEDVDGDRRLPIWIGAAEASALVAVLEQIELPRPGPYHFAAALLGAAGTGLREVRISRLVDAIFYAEVVLTNDSTIDARPSDALTLAVIEGVPIYADSAVLAVARRTEAALPDYLDEASNARDDVRVLAQEARTRIAENAKEVAEVAARVREKR